MKNFKAGDQVLVCASYGIGEPVKFFGTVTFNNPASPYIVVNGQEYRKYEVSA